jgi:hypothetical protein
VRDTNFLGPSDATDGEHQIKPDYAARQMVIDCRLTTPIFITKFVTYFLVTSKAYVARDTTKLVVSVMHTPKPPHRLLAQLLQSRSFD